MKKFQLIVSLDGFLVVRVVKALDLEQAVELVRNQEPGRTVCLQSHKEVV